MLTHCAALAGTQFFASSIELHRHTHDTPMTHPFSFSFHTFSLLITHSLSFSQKKSMLCSISCLLNAQIWEIHNLICFSKEPAKESFINGGAINGSKSLAKKETITQFWNCIKLKNLNKSNSNSNFKTNRKYN